MSVKDGALFFSITAAFSGMLLAFSLVAESPAVGEEAVEESFKDSGFLFADFDLFWSNFSSASADSLFLPSAALSTQKK